MLGAVRFVFVWFVVPFLGKYCYPFSLKLHKNCCMPNEILFFYRINEIYTRLLCGGEHPPSDCVPKAIKFAINSNYQRVTSYELENYILLYDKS